MDAPSGSSHYTFRKQGKVNYNTKHEPIKKSICRNGKKVVRKRERKMKTLNEYMSMSYKMEIIEDQDEVGL